MALRNIDKILELYNESDTIQKDFTPPKSPVLDTNRIDKNYSNYNKRDINFRYRLPNNKSNSYVSTLTRHLVDDTVRYAKFYASGKGILFNTVQSGLNLMNPNTEFNGLVNPNRIFDPSSLVKSSLGAPFGIRSSRSPVSKNQYENVTTSRNNERQNRLVRIYKELKLDEFNNANTPYSILTDKQNKLKNRLSQSKVGRFVNDALKKPGVPIKTLSNIAGPKSFLGIGSTVFRKYYLGQEPSLKYINNKGVESYYPNRSSDNPYTGADSQLLELYNQLYVEQGLQPSELATDGTQLNKVTLGNNNNFQSLSEFSKNKYGYNNFESKEFFEKRNDRFKNEPAYKGKYDSTENYYENWNYHRRLNIPEAKEGESDLINEVLDANTLANYEIISQDFIKLKIGNIQFRCIMSGLSDSMSPEWNSTRYIGRPDDVYTYSGAKRTISFQLTVYAFSVREMRGIYDKLNKLYQYVSPIVSNGLQTGQIINLKIGDWFSTKQYTSSAERSSFNDKEQKLKKEYQDNDNISSRLFNDKSKKNKSGFATLSNRGLPVIIDSISVGIDDNFSWDIIMELPMMFTIDLSFTVIDNESPNSNKIYFASGLMKS